MKNNKMKLGIAAVVVVLILIVSLVTPKLLGNRNKIVVGTKDFTEQLILGNMYADLIEANTDLKVERKLNLGGTNPCFESLKSGSIDMYIEYSGTVDLTLLKNKFEVLPNEEVIERITNQMHEKYGVKVLEEIGFNNAYCLAIKPELASENNIEKISDLELYPNEFKFASSTEFLNREDGIESLNKKYTLDFIEEIPIEGGLRYKALASGEADVVCAFSTDGMLKKYDLKMLEDDKGALVQYRAVPLVREEILEKYPELEEVLGKLTGVLTDEIMVELNYKVDEEKSKPEDVAHQFLEEQGLL